MAKAADRNSTVQAEPMAKQVESPVAAGERHVSELIQESMRKVEEEERNERMEQLLTSIDARLMRLESARSKPMKGFKGTQLADLAFEANVRFMEIFVSESSRVLQNTGKEHLLAFLDVWPRYVAAVDKAEIAGKWISAREKQGGHTDNPPSADAPP